MKAQHRPIGLLMVVLLTGGSVKAVQSDPVLVDASSRYRHWTTVYTNAVALRWNWAANATHATLEIAGMNTAVTTNFSGAVSNWLWRVSASEGSSAEDVYVLTLTFWGEGGSAAGALTSRLAVVKGALETTTVDAVSESRSWAQVKANVVVPYDANWSSLSADADAATLSIAKVGGVSSTNVFTDTAGYYGWKLRKSGWGYGTFDLSLIFSGMTNEWAATLLRPLDGTAVRVR